MFMTTKQKAQEVSFRTLNDRTNLFISKSCVVHNNKYDYSLVAPAYINSHSKVPIICHVHGLFHQTPNNHINGQGCPICSDVLKLKMGHNRRLSIEQFIEKSREVFGELYDYTDSVYLNSNNPINITCPMHGTFTVRRAEKHYRDLQGCPTCGTHKSIGENIISTFLSRRQILYKCEYKFDDCVSPYTGKHLRFDFFLPLQSTLIEYHGEQHFTPNRLMHEGDKFVRFREYDEIKRLYAVTNNYKYVVLTKDTISNINTLELNTTHN